MAKKIYLSPSNQNANTYAYGNTNEMVQCNRIAEYAEKALKRCGFSVKRAPQGQAMYTSINESNSWGADLHIPIHTNAYNGKVTGGTLVMLFSNNTTNNKAGKAILDAVSPISPGSDYSLRYNPELAELNGTSAVAVYLEVEFHDTKDGAKWIVDNVKKIGEAIAKGVCNLYGVKYVAETTPAVNLEVALLQALLRQAYAQGICKTFISKIDNKKSTDVNSAIKEAKQYLKYKTVDATNDLKFIVDLEHEVNVVRLGREEKLKAQLEKAESREIGDVNADGKVNIKDATALQKQVAGIEE